MEAFFEQQKVCPICGNRFNVTRVRSSACFVIHRESDFRVKYRDVNPLLYCIWVCPNCQYANTDKDYYQEFIPVEMDRLQKGLPILKTEEPDFSGVRTVQTASRAVELAIRTAMIRQAPAIIRAGLYLRGAWLYRELGKSEEELKYLQEAKNLYQHSFEKEWSPYNDKMSDSRIMYLIGELNRRLNNNEEAVKWFSRVVMNKDIKKEPEINRLVRDQWEIAREAYKKQRAGQVPEQVPALAENTGEAALPVGQDIKPLVPTAKSRGSKVKMYLNLYMDQVDWLKNLSNKAYDVHKVSIEKEAVIRAVFDAVMETCTDLDFKSEEELKDAIKARFVTPSLS